MEEKLVSIIVPIYSVEKYIDNGIASLVAQDYENIEIILVDDGSPDKSGIIADKWAAKDGRIIVIHQSNSGVSTARNAGLKAAKGEFVMFMDGDDWVERDYVSYFMGLVTAGNYRAAFNINFFHDNGRDTNRQSVSDLPFHAEEAIEGIYSGKIDVAVWNKIYNRELITKHGIRFNPEIWFGEGMLFNMEVLQRVDCVAMGGKPVYHQTFNPESAMRKFNLDNYWCGMRSLELQKKKWIKTNKSIEKQWEYHKYRFNLHILTGIIRSGMEAVYPEELRTSIREIRKGILMPLTLERSVKGKMRWICYYVAPITMAKRAARKYMKLKKLAETNRGGGA